MTAVLVKLVPEAPRLGSNSQIRVFEKAKGDYWRRSWVRQSSGAVSYTHLTLPTTPYV